MAKLHTPTPLFALEYTPTVLRLLALEETAQRYQVAHYEQRLLAQHRPQGGVVQSLQEMRSALGARACAVNIGIHDAELILRCLPVASTRMQDIYAHCQTQLSHLFNLKQYTWDAYLSSSKTQALCALYPLQKIIFLQEICRYCDLQLQVVEPSICALARASYLLLKWPQALFLSFEAHRFTLFLAVKGEVFAVRQFNEAAQLSHHSQDLINNMQLTPYMEKITALYTVQEMQTTTALCAIHSPWPLQPIDVLSYVQAGKYSAHADGLQLFTCVGLALRQFI